jgi:ribosomal protein S18 acetylase RimI-like enzyme
MGAVADLIATAFGSEIDGQGRAALRELRWMARLSPLVWWWAQADPTFHDAYNGFVWEEPSPKGRGRQVVVGNANLNRTPGDRTQWVICNVVVREEYRGRGIARRLMEANIAEAQKQGAEGVVLQVYRANLRALHLYTDLGFQQVAGETEMCLETIQSVALLDPVGYHLRPWQPADGQAAYNLASLAMPTMQQWLRPVRRGDYERDAWARLEHRLADLLAGRRTYRLAAFKEADLVATMAVQASFRRGEHALSLLVHPQHRGHLEPVLVGRALHMLAGLPVRAVRATASTDHTAALEALGNYGFREKRTLLTMSYNLGNRELGHEYG